MQNKLNKLYKDINMQLDKHDNLKEKLKKQTAGNRKVYRGPKKGLFIINKNGNKIYIDRKGLK